MAILDVVTAGFGNGTFSGSIPFVVTRGYTINPVVSPWTVQSDSSTSWSAQSNASTTWASQTDSSTTWTVQDGS